jgi:hypothetical protein
VVIRYSNNGTNIASFSGAKAISSKQYFGEQGDDNYGEDEGGDLAVGFRDLLWKAGEKVSTVR